MSERRVVITGLGISSALGNDRDAFWQGMLEGAVGIDRIGEFDPVKFDCQVGGEVGQIKVNKLVPKFHRKATKLMSRDIKLAVVAADGAVRDAGLKTRGTVDNGDDIEIEPTRSVTVSRSRSTRSASTTIWYHSTMIDTAKWPEELIRQLRQHRAGVRRSAVRLKAVLVRTRRSPHRAGPRYRKLM